MARIEKQDPELYHLILAEEKRQAETLNLIASENFAPLSVREASASVFTNKYTEGYPGARYYAGCEVFDEVEELAKERLLRIFGGEHANVQPHSGASANNAVFQALLRPGDKILGLALDHGGHLTHGMKINVSGDLYEASSYHVDKDFNIDMDEVREKAEQEKAKLIIAGWSAYTDFLDWQAFREIADEVGAYLLVDMAHFAGLVAGDVYPNPVPYADVVTSTTHKTLSGPRGGIIICREDLAPKIDKAVFPGQQGGALGQQIAAKALAFHLVLEPSWKTYAKQTVANASALASSLSEEGLEVICKGRTHQVLLDLQGESGKQAEEALEKNGIVANRNTIPFDPRPPRDPSGLRFGSPALTTRGMKEKEFSRIGQLIAKVLKGESIQEEVKELTEKFPLEN